MTKSYLTNITPDSISGILFALEGMVNTVVLLNGPSGCKFYHSAVSDSQVIRQSEFDPMNFPEAWFFGQPRVPCTYLDKRDYVYGSQEKLTDALTYIEEKTTCDLIAIVNSPGAALIGDDLAGIAGSALHHTPYVIVESPAYSQPIWHGYAQATRALVEQIPFVKTTHVRKRVNLLGLSLYHKYAQGDLAELKRLLNLCGIEVGTVLGYRSTLKDLEQLTSSDLNVVVYPEYGLELAQHLEQTQGMPYFCPETLPLGFAATEGFIRQLCQMLGVDSRPALQEGERARATAYGYISRVNSMTGLPKGATFAVSGTRSQCRAYASFLTQYFGMIGDQIHELEQPDGPDILETKAQLVFADANILAQLRVAGHQFCGIEISLPSFGYLDVIPKTHLGFTGALWLVEQVLNGLLF